MGGTAQRAAHRIQGETLIAASASAAWDVLSDFHGVDTWARPVTRVVALGPAARGVGAARRCDIRGLGAVDEVVTVWEEGRRLGYRVSPVGPIGRSESLWEIEPVGPLSTRVRLRLDYDMRFGPLGALLHALLVRRLLGRNLPGALAAPKRRVETGRVVRRPAAGRPRDAWRRWFPARSRPVMRHGGPRWKAAGGFVRAVVTAGRRSG